MAASNSYIDQKKAELNEVLEHLKKELLSLRSGRAQSAIVENVQVEAYGVTTPLKQLASLSISDAKSILIEPWDKSIMKSIEKALGYANLGLAVINNGDKIIAQVPPMTEENRKNLIKVVGEKAEEAKISLRQIRDEIKSSILEAEKNNDITQDDKFKFLADLDNFISDYNKKVDVMVVEKEKEIMTI
jgi:ribosome recycling factor